MDAPLKPGGAGLLGAGLAIAGLGFLLVMALLGEAPRTQNLVKFEPAGLMRETPDRIERVELAAGGRHWILARAPGGGWRSGAGVPLPAPLASHLEMSLQFMHAASPVRSMSRQEYAGESMGEFGLDPPRYVVSLLRGDRPVLVARFGRSNSQGSLQYVRVDGRDELFLLPIFVGREWEQVMDGA